MSLKDDALKFHEGGKFETTLKHEINNRNDLSLAYTPGVANACLAIKETPELAYKYTSKGNIVAVITDGTAVLVFKHKEIASILANFLNKFAFPYA